MRLAYDALGRAAKGTVREFLGKVTGLSRPQVTRLIGQYRATGRVGPRALRAPVTPVRIASVQPAAVADLPPAARHVRPHPTDHEVQYDPQRASAERPHALQSRCEGGHHRLPPRERSAGNIDAVR